MLSSTAPDDGPEQLNPEMLSWLTLYPATGVPLACTGRTRIFWVCGNAAPAVGAPTAKAASDAASTPAKAVRASRTVRRIGAVHFDEGTLPLLGSRGAWR